MHAPAVAIRAAWPPRLVTLAGAGLLLAGVAIGFSDGPLRVAIASVAGVGVCLIASRRPHRALVLVAGMLPFQQVVLAGYFSLGVPGPVLRVAGFWKEAVLVGCAVAALRAARRVGRSPDVIDWLAIAYLSVVGLYYLAPGLVVASAEELGAPPSLHARTVGLRAATGFVVAFLVARHLPRLPTALRSMTRTLFGVGIAVATIGLVEYVFSDWWNSLLVEALEVPAFKAQVLGVSVLDPTDLRVSTDIGSREVLRIGSVFIDQLACSFFLVTGLLVAVHRIALGSTRVLDLGGAATIGVALLLTQTRSTLLGALIGVVVVLRATPRGTLDRARLLTLLAVAALALAPVIVATGLADRTTSAVGGGEPSAVIHQQRTSSAFDALIDRPFGRGLGTGGATGLRFEVDGQITSENHYLLIANETGVASMVSFVGLLVTACRRLRCKRTAATAGDLVAVPRATVVGLSVTAMLLQVWADPAVAWGIWAMFGYAIADVDERSGAGNRRTGEEPAPGNRPDTAGVSAPRRP